MVSMSCARLKRRAGEIIEASKSQDGENGKSQAFLDKIQSCIFAGALIWRSEVGFEFRQTRGA